MHMDGQHMLPAGCSCMASQPGLFGTASSYAIVTAVGTATATGMPAAAMAVIT